MCAAISRKRLIYQPFHDGGELLAFEMAISGIYSLPKERFTQRTVYGLRTILLCVVIGIAMDCYFSQTWSVVRIVLLTGLAFVGLKKLIILHIDYIYEKAREVDEVSVRDATSLREFWLEHMNKDTGCLWFVKRIDQTLVGTIGYVETEAGTVELMRMLICEEHRGKGYGKEMIDFLEDFTLRKGYKKMILTTSLDQIEAIALYKRCNFSVDSENVYLSVFVLSQYRVYYMSKDLV